MSKHAGSKMQSSENGKGLLEPRSFEGRIKTTADYRAAFIEIAEEFDAAIESGTPAEEANEKLDALLDALESESVEYYMQDWRERHPNATEEEITKAESDALTAIRVLTYMAGLSYTYGGDPTMAVVEERITPEQASDMMTKLLLADVRRG